MKNLLYIVFLAAVLTGCEVIREQDRLLPVDLSADSTGSRHVLIEFTGFRCVNCPTAAADAELLHQRYPENLVVVAMHPADNHFTQTTLPQYDYTCPEANVYYNYFGGSGTTPFPTGIVDFVSEWSAYNDWASLVRSSVMKEKPGHVDIALSNLRPKTREFAFSLVVSADSTLETQALLWLVADSVQGAQQMPDGSSNRNYTHRNRNIFVQYRR